MKKLIPFLLCLTLLLCGCNKASAPTETTTFFETASTANTFTETMPENIQHSGSWILFETVFLPIAEGTVEITQDAVTDFLTQQGFEWSLGEGQLSVPDPEHPGSFLSADLTTIHEEVELASLSYHFIIEEAPVVTEVVQRAVKVDFMDGGPQYYIALDWLGNGTEVASIQDLADYIMTAALRPEETPMGVYAARMTKVLSGEAAYTSIDGIETMPVCVTLSEYLESFPIPAFFAKASAADMDGDGFNEILLSIVQPEHEEETGCLVLHYQGGIIFGATYYHRQLNSLKSDGTFSWAGSASHNGTGILEFGEYDPYAPLSEYKWNMQEINMCDAGEFGSGTYLAGGIEADEEAFYRAMEVQDAKQDAPWVPFPSDKLDILFK